jgi:competence protein ComEC
VCTVGVGSSLLCVALVATALAICVCGVERRAIAVAGWLGLCAAWAMAPRGAAVGVLRVTFMDVGQGDAAIIEVPDGEVWLIDAGGLASSRDVAAASAPGEAITRTLAVYGHDAIDVAILSHPHPDHFMGLAGLGVPVRELWVADRNALRIPVIAALAGRGTRIVVPPLGVARTAGDVALRVLAPQLDGVLAPDPVRSVNDNSLVIAVEYAGRSVLFAGDLEAEGEVALVDAGLGHVDIVKVPHHGSPTSSSAAFVAATHPSLAVISCGVANAFGFPGPDVVARWRAAGAAVARTDRDGAVIVGVSRDGRLHVGR